MPIRKRPLLDSLCCCLNVLFHPQQEKHVPYFDNGRDQVEIRAREDVMMTYGVVPGTLGRTGTRAFNGVDPRLCTPSHGRSQYYMGSNSNGPQQYYHVDEGTGEDQMNYMNDLDAAMTRPIAYPQYDGDEGQGYYQQAPHHLMATGGVDHMDLDHDPYNHMQNFEQSGMHRKESNDRRVEDELWQGCVVAGGMQDQQQQFFVSQSQLAVGQEGYRSGTRGRGTRKKARNENGQYQVGGMGSAVSSSYNVHAGEGGGDVGVVGVDVGMVTGKRYGRGGHNGEEPIYEEILSSGGSVGGRQNGGYPMVGSGQSRHLSAFLNEKGNSVISCLEPIK